MAAYELTLAAHCTALLCRHLPEVRSRKLLRRAVR